MKRLLSALVLFGSLGLNVQAATDDLDGTLREAVIHVPVSVPDLHGRTISGELLVSTFRPPGPGPFPLVVISHGRPASMADLAHMQRQRFESASRYFVRKGFAVAVPLRLGAGELAAAGDPEAYGGCRQPDYLPGLKAAGQEINAVARQMQQQGDIDPSRLVLVGVSAGGIATVAAVAQHPPGLVTAINFAGGRGGDPAGHPGVPCGGPQIGEAMAGFGRAAQVPMLWIYAENDLFFNPEHSRAWAQAYQDQGGRLDFRLVPPHGRNGHTLFSTGNDAWQPWVDQYLLGFGFQRPGRLERPAPARALLGPEDAPASLAAGDHQGFADFLAHAAPKAFAVDGQGAWGWASGDDALSKALANCQRRRARACALYAVDEGLLPADPHAR